MFIKSGLKVGDKIIFRPNSYIEFKNYNENDYSIASITSITPASDMFGREIMVVRGKIIDGITFGTEGWHYDPVLSLEYWERYLPEEKIFPEGVLNWLTSQPLYELDKEIE